MRPRIPRPVARRLDRLAWRAHLFHRYAHHPLCDEYRGEVIPLGRRGRVCRGCTLVATGFMGGLLVGTVLPLAPLVALGGAVGLVGLSLTRWGHRRPSKIRTRLLPALGLAIAFARGLRTMSWLGAAVAGVALAVTISLVLIYRRRPPDRSPCQTCPERMLGSACRGLRPIARRERAFQRLAGRILARSL